MNKREELRELQHEVRKYDKPKPKKLTEDERFAQWYKRAAKESLTVQYASYGAMRQAWKASARAKR